MQQPPPGYGGAPPQAPYGAPQPPPQAPYGAPQPPPGFGPPPDRKASGSMQNPAHVGQATFSEEDEFVDPSGKYKLVKKGAYAAVECAITSGDLVKAESGAMVTMSSNVHLEARLEGSPLAAAFRSCCAGESMFMSHFSLQQGQRGDLLLAPSSPGEIIMIHMDGQREWAIQHSSYMASDESIAVGVKTQGLAACCCSGEGLFVLRASGRGRLLINSFGAIMRYDLKAGEVRKIDNGFLVAWENHLNYTISKAGSSVIGSFLSGEGFVTTFTGPGRVYIQTRSAIGLAAVLQPYIAPNGGGGGGGGAIGAFV